MPTLRNRRRHSQATIAVVASAVFSQTVRAGYPSLHSQPAVEFSEDNADLEAILRSPPIQQHERLSEALQIIHPIQSGPRCHYQAALNLLNDCKFLEKASSASAAANSDSEFALDDLETVYAARLAVCELMSANAAIPPACKVVAASKEACLKKRPGLASWFSPQELSEGDRLCYPEPEPQKLKKCMNAIYVQPQAWMSYSNARQNAVVMCHASRDAIEKEKTLSHYQSMGEAVSLMASMLEQYSAHIKMWLSEHDALVQKIRNSSEQVLQDMHEGLSTFESIKNAFRSFAGMMYRTSEAYGDEINNSLKKSKADMAQHFQEIRSFQEDIVETSLQHATGQRTQLQMSHEQAVAILRSYHNAAMDTLHSNHQAAISRVEEVASTIDGLKEKVELSTSNLDAINQGLENVNTTVQRLHAATEKLPEIMHVFTAYGSIFARPQLLLAAVLCIIGLWRANGKIAGYFMAGAGFSYMFTLIHFKAYGQSALSLSKSTLAVIMANRLPIAFVFAALAGFWFLSAVIHNSIRATYLCEVVDEEGEKTVLPSIENPNPPTPPPSSLPREERRRFGFLRTLHFAS